MNDFLNDEEFLESLRDSLNTPAKKKTSLSKKNVFSKIRDAMKSRMRIVEIYLCDRCNTSIIKPEDGYVVHGNIFTAGVKEKGGLIGQNFPKPDEDGKVSISAIKKTVLCKTCFMFAITTDKKKSDIYDDNVPF